MLLLPFLRYCCSKVGQYYYPPSGMHGEKWLILVYCFYTVLLYFSTYNGYICLFEFLKSNLCDKLRTNLCGPFVLLCSCYYFDNNCSILFFILFSGKELLLFMTNSILCFKFLSRSLCKSKSKSKVFGSLIITIFSSIIFVNFFDDIIMLIQEILLLLYFFSLSELFLAFICANNTGSLVNSLLGVKIFNPFP